jgi:uncharacterized protein YcbK (DUF882 family)
MLWTSLSSAPGLGQDSALPSAPERLSKCAIEASTPARMTSPHARVLPPLVAAILLALSAVYPGAARAAEVVHVVARGQTLGAIARKYHVPVAALREANGLKSWQQIHPGLSLTIPGAADPKGKVDPRGKRDPKGKALPPPPVEPPPPVRGGKGAKGRKDEGNEKAEALAHPPKRPGFVRMLRGSEKLEAQLLTRRGKLVPATLPGLGRVLRYYPTNEKIAIDPRLATLIGLVSDHFGGRTIHIVSGFRPYSPVQYAPRSNHNLGRAMDFSIEGVPNTVLRDFCRTFRNAGVGYYPNGTFVHLDVRTTKTTWVDYSRSGEAPRYESGGGPPSADEVEPHGGAEPGAGGPDAAPGSGEPQVGPSEPADSTGGN